MNPFSAFLQPPAQRSPLAGAGEFVQDMQRVGLQRQQLAQNQQAQQDSSARDWKRIGLQEQVQNRNISEEDRKQVEGLLAEYQQAEDQGDQVTLARAEQALKRYGLDVNKGPKDMSAFTGVKPLPGMLPAVPQGQLPKNPTPEQVLAFTGTPVDQANPIGDAIKTEQASRAALRARNAQPEQELSQEDFETQLINKSESEQAPERYEQGGQTTPEFKAKLQGMNAGLPEVETPQEQVIDLDKDNPAPLQIGKPQEQAAEAPQAAAQTPAPLPGMLPQVRISKGGKTLYESTGPSGRWAPMVQSVFEPLTKNQNPDLAAAGQRAMQMAGKLIGVDGIAPKDAIKFAAERYKEEEANIIGLERTKLGSNANRRGGGGGAPGLLGKTQDIAESIQVYDDNARQAATKLEEEDRQYEDIEAKANSGDPAMVRDAINVLFKIRSGTAVSAAEDARISTINGLLPKIQDLFGRWTGGAPSPELIRYIQQVAQLKRQANAAKRQRIYDHQADLYEAQNKGKTKDPNIITERAKRIREGGDEPGKDLSHLWE